jgi:ribosomal protein S6--L-glutamate ligase
MILRKPSELKARYPELGPGDLFIGRLPAGQLRELWAVDLLERGVRFLPSLRAQQLSRSKAAQAWLFSDVMAPHTTVIARRVELLEAGGRYARDGIGPVVTKQEGLHCGHGVRRWDSVEAAYNALAFDEQAYPFVLQPFLEAIVDVRVIVVGGYVEAYTRENPLNFRANLAAGGRSRRRELDAAQEGFCRKVMARGGFPYAHIDLHLAPGGACYLSEIALEVGITGARIGRSELGRLKREALERLAAGAEPPESSPEGLGAGFLRGRGEGDP